MQGAVTRWMPEEGIVTDIEQPLTRGNLINLAHCFPKQPKDFDLHLIETFNEVVNLILHDHADPVNPFKQLEDPTSGRPLSQLIDLIGKALMLTG